MPTKCTDIDLLKELVNLHEHPPEHDQCDENCTKGNCPLENYYGRLDLLHRVLVRRWLTDQVERRETIELISAFVNHIMGGSNDPEVTH